MASSKLLVKIQGPSADRRQILQTVKLLSEAHFSRFNFLEVNTDSKEST